MDEHIIEERWDREPNATNDRRGLHEDRYQHTKNSHTLRHPPLNSPPKSRLETMPCGHTRGGRNLIVCIDGRASQLGRENTNVAELYHLILKEVGDNQCTWYNSGVGDYLRPHWRSPRYYIQTLVRQAEFIIQGNFVKTILGAYRWLVDNYQEGDCIFLFGFSRGALQVRILSAMIRKVGLIRKGNETQIPFAYDLYADPNSDAEPAVAVGSTAGEKLVSMAQRFKEASSHKNVTVHFVGAWDTISSIGIARGNRVLPGTSDGMTHVCYFRHALALDERRVKFLPEYAWGGTTLPPPGAKPNVDRSHGDPVHPCTLEVWFAGTHSDIGGGNSFNIGMDRSRPPLKWMASQAAELGLRIGQFERELSSSEQIAFRESLAGGWHLLELLPFRRLTFARTRLNSITRIPHLWSGRKIHEGQKFHCSFILGEMVSVYTPKARPQNDTQSDNRSFWSDLRINGLHSNLVEFDVFYLAARTVKRLLTGENDDGLVRQIAAYRMGPQLLYDKVIETLQMWDEREPRLELSVKCRLLQTTIDVFQGSSDELRPAKWDQIPNLLTDLLESDSADHRKLAQDFQRQFMGKDVHTPFELRGHVHAVGAVAISPDSKHIVSGSYDDTIRIWDVKTGAQVGEPLRGHTSSVWSVAISSDGKYIVSGSSDKTIRIWDLETRKQVKEPLRGHTGDINSVAISRDGKRVVSGSDDDTIRIWDAKTGEQVGEPLVGHIGMVYTVAISPDGKRIVSGSSDGTIRIWDAEEGEQLGEPLQGHTGTVYSVTISPDGKRLVSGSGDSTIRIWDVETRKQVGEPLHGHKDGVLSVAISSDGKRIISGSGDDTIRIWNAERILF